jgi:DNA-binding SARP family transcriptional activator
LQSERIQNVLAYLLLNRHAPISRQQLAFAFWPDITDAQARHNLRTLLTRCVKPCHVPISFWPLRRR